jgi:hypothetical protein
MTMHDRKCACCGVMLRIPDLSVLCKWLYRRLLALSGVMRRESGSGFEPRRSRHFFLAVFHIFQDSMTNASQIKDVRTLKFPKVIREGHARSPAGAGHVRSARQRRPGHIAAKRTPDRLPAIAHWNCGWLKGYGGSAINRKNFCVPVMKLV